MTTFKEKFGNRLREIRKSKGYTQEQVAEKIGIEPPNMSKLEKGLHFPLPENIEKIAKALDVNVRELFDFQHFDEKNELINKLKKYIDTAEDKEIEFLYKTMVNLNQFKG